MPTLNVRLSESEMREAKRQAGAAGASVSDWVRGLIMGGSVGQGEAGVALAARAVESASGKSRAGGVEVEHRHARGQGYCTHCGVLKEKP